MLAEPASLQERVRLPSRLLATLAAAALLATSCSRQIPTGPSHSVTVTRSTGPATSSYDEDADSQVMVRLASGVDAADFARDYNLTLVHRSTWGGATFRPQGGVSPDKIASRMIDDPRVITAERDQYLETAETRQESFAFDDGYGTPGNYAEQAATQSIGLDWALQVSRGANVGVAILDTGADLTHPALLGHVDLQRSWDFVSGTAVPTDVGDGLDNDGDGFVDEAWGHGTHVAGIVARTAPGARLLIVRVLDADGRGDLLNVISGIHWAIDHDAKVINMSLGMLNSSDAMQEALEEAEEHGVVCVCSAGNWGSNQPEDFPASSSHVLAVAALGAQDCAAPFTSFGIFVSISAPGVAVRSAYPLSRYWVWSGTSMSAPFVSGGAALLLSLHPDWNKTDVMNRLAWGARPLPAGSGLGAGALDLARAMAPDYVEPDDGDAELIRH